MWRGNSFEVIFVKHVNTINDYHEIVESLEENAENPYDFTVLGWAYYNLGKNNKAISSFKKAIDLDPENTDALFNIAEIYLQMGKFSKAKGYALKLIKILPNDWAVHDILSVIYDYEGFYDKSLEHLSEALKSAPAEFIPNMKFRLNGLKEKISSSKSKKRLAFICAKGLDNFIDDITRGFQNRYWIQRWAVTNNQEIKTAIDWADIVWLEWANEVAVIGTNYPGIWGKDVIVRLHSYEIFTDFPREINWGLVSALIFIAPHIKEIFFERFPDLKDLIRNFEIIYNGVKLEGSPFEERKPGFEIAWVAHINYKKAPELAIQIIGELTKINSRYRLHIAGDFQDPRYETYLRHIVKAMNIEKNVIFHGWVDDMEEFWKGKNYLLSTSLHEGHPYNIMEAMARGIKPVIHWFRGAEMMYKRDWIFSDVKGALNIILSSEYNSNEYRSFLVEKGFTLEAQLKGIDGILSEVSSSKGNNKVLIWNTFKLGRKGGPSGYLYNLKKFLDDEKIDWVEFLNVQMPAKDFNEMLEKPFPFRMDKLRKFKCIHFHDTINLYRFVNQYGKPKDIQLVLTPHSPKPTHIEIIEDWWNMKISDISHSVYKKLENIDIVAFDNADVVIFPCYHSKESYYKRWKYFERVDENKFKYIPTGVPEVELGKPSEEIRTNVRKRYRVPPGAFVISYVGRHNFTKGFDVLKSAGEEILRKYEDIYFLIGGRQRPLKGVDHPRWIEVGYTKKPWEIMLASDVFLSPNRETFFDLVVLEALSLSKPVILSYTGGNKCFEQFRDMDVVYFKGEDVEDAIRAIEEAHSKKESMKGISFRNYEIYRENFSIEIFGNRYVNLMKNLCIKGKSF